MPTNQITFWLRPKIKEVFVLSMDAGTLSIVHIRTFQKQITDCESALKSTGRAENVKQQFHINNKHIE